MGSRFLKKAAGIGLLSCLMVSIISIGVSAKDTVENTSNGYRIIRNGSVDGKYFEASGIEDIEYQEKMNSLVQKKALDEFIHGILFSIEGWKYEANELNEVRDFQYVYGTDDYMAYIYGDILSLCHHDIWRYKGEFDKNGVWESSKVSQQFDVRNYNLKTGDEVKLSDILMLGDEFFDILENAEIELYNGEYEIGRYDAFLYQMKSEIDNQDFVKDGKTSTYKWLIDEQGYLLIGENSVSLSFEYFKVPLTIFASIVKPEYAEYVQDDFKGYDFYSTADNAESESVSDGTEEFMNLEEELDCVYRTYMYEDDIKLEYFQVTGLKDIELQCQLNDYIMQSIMDGVIDDLSYAYMNNGYYAEESRYNDKESLIFVEAVSDDYYQNGHILSFTNTQQVTRKAYTTKDGIDKEEISKGPYFQAFNYDISKGKELTFSDVFNADDEMFEIIKKWFREESGYFDWDKEWNRDDEGYIENYRKSLGLQFIDDMIFNFDGEREEFANSEVEFYHWFIDHSEEGSNLCIYRYNTIDCEEKCLKIPMSILKDKIKPEYEDAF